MKKLHVSFALTLFVSFQIFGQTYVSSKFLKSYTKSYFQTQYQLIFANYDVDCFEMHYTTLNPEGQLDTASGLVSVPKQLTNNYPILAYLHGTVGSRDEVPSKLSFEHTIPSIFTSVGWIGIAPDYIGLGISKGVHPYVHAASEASATRDMLVALPDFLKTINIKSTKDLFITGYSQGGHSGMAFHRLVEQSNLGYSLKAAAHMSGPYDISQSMKNLLLSEEEYFLVAYAANVALSYNRVYHIFPNNQTTDVFKSPYAEEIQKYAEEKTNLWDLNTFMVNELKKNGGKAQPKRMFLDQVVADVITNNDHPINLALRDNDVYDWSPQTPTRLLYCKADDQVSYNNSIVAFEKMKANGAKDILAIDVKSDASHTQCVQPAITQTLFFFLNYLNVTSSESNVFTEITCYPNPASQFIKIKGVNDTFVTFINKEGKTYQKQLISENIDLSELPADIYFLLLKDDVGQNRVSKVIKI